MRFEIAVVNTYDSVQFTGSNISEVIAFLKEKGYLQNVLNSVVERPTTIPLTIDSEDFYRERIKEWESKYGEYSDVWKYQKQFSHKADDFYPKAALDERAAIAILGQEIWEAGVQYSFILKNKLGEKRKFFLSKDDWIVFNETAHDLNFVSNDEMEQRFLQNRKLHCSPSPI